MAAPADEITRAVVASGAANVQSATPAQFSSGYTSVIIRVKEARRCEYLTAAISLRPDLAPQITAATLRARGGIEAKDGIESKDGCNWVDSTLRCALAAAPAAKEAILRAALEAAPEARECILAFGNAGNSGSFRPPGVDAGNINSTSLGSINPGNFAGQNNVTSGNQGRITICHNLTTTLTLPRPAADAHLRNHPNDYLGACRP
ncbi:MAG: hypothetical protein ABI992_03985 [Chthoniobacterales bacterium]